MKEGDISLREAGSVGMSVGPFIHSCTLPRSRSVLSRLCHLEFRFASVSCTLSREAQRMGHKHSLSRDLKATRGVKRGHARTLTLCCAECSVITIHSNSHVQVLVALSSL